MSNRVIKESIKRSPQIDSLTWFEEVVFYRLIVTADDYGCIDGRPILIKNELFPTRENVTRKSVEEAIAKLVSVGLLFQYEVDGRPYLVFPTWEKHQRIRNKHRKHPAPPDGMHLTATCCQVSASRTPESESESESESKYENISAEPATDSTPPVIELPLNDGSMYPISQEQCQEWAGLYPAVNVIQQLRQMRGWLDANPTKRKTKRGVNRFIIGWLARTQDKGGDKHHGADIQPAFSELAEFI